ncbi:uncharacterized protein DEA37_0000839 [Paragonimus westermani]|uniref:PH domain-containing protein n=1 Tax=Paragonimus westermani TaxID=34504 RepID=A0A5J4NQ73_9TREM|nr:uncharacterized protein DEA37_0000839 [Paragonimus westermani]
MLNTTPKLFNFIRTTFGADILQVINNRITLAKKHANWVNHRVFNVRCLSAKVVPPSLLIRPPDNSVRSKCAALTASRISVRQRVHSTTYHLECIRFRCANLDELIHHVLPDDIRTSVMELINQRELTFLKKASERQRRKFDKLFGRLNHIPSVPHSVAQRPSENFVLFLYNKQSNDRLSPDRRCVDELQDPVSTASHRRESHFRPNAKFNNMYVGAEEFLYGTKSIGLSVLQERLESRPKIINNGSAIQIDATSCRFDETTSMDGFKTAAISPFHQTPTTRKRLQQLQTHYSVLTEHLNRQRSRLASADATVADLVKTLFKFGVEEPSNQMPNIEDTTWTARSMYGQPDTAPFTRTPNAESNFQNTRLTDVKHLPMPAWSDNVRIRNRHNQENIDHGRHKFATICARSVCHLTAFDSENAASFDWEQPQVKLLSNDQAFRRKFCEFYLRHCCVAFYTVSLTRPITQTSTSRLATNDYIPLSDTCSYFAQLPTSVHPHSNDTRYFSSAFHRLPQKYRQNVAHLSHVTGPEIAPPLPPKPSLPRVSLAPTISEDPQCVEDEEVSKFMTNPNVLDGEKTGKEQVADSSIAFLDLISVQRPPPPPYYVNLFDSGKRKKQSELDVAPPPQQTDSPGTKQSSPPPRSTTPEGHRNSTSQQQLQTSTKITPTSRRYTRPSQVCQINLPEYLAATGHSLERLTRPPDQSRSGTPQMKPTNQTATCFNTLLTRWFRAGSHRMPKHRGRTRSLDENETKIQLPLSFDSLSSFHMDARVILTRVRCEGYLWVLRQPRPGRTHITNTRHRSRPWQSLREHYRGVTSDTSGQNSSPSVTQDSLEKRESQHWKQMWFVCDLAGRIFASQQEPYRERHKDCVPLSSIQSIRISQCSNMTDMCKSSLQYAVPEAELITTDALPNPVENNQSQLAEKNSLNLQDCLTRSLKDDITKDEEPRWTDSVFHVESLTRTYTLRAANTELRALWMAVLEVGKFMIGLTENVYHAYFALNW